MRTILLAGAALLCAQAAYAQQDYSSPAYNRLRAYHLSGRSDLLGGTVWPGINTAEGFSNLFVTGGVSGTTSTGDASINYLAIPSDTLDCHTAAGNLCSGFELAHNFGGVAMKGARTGIGAMINLTAKSGNTTGVGGSYVAGQFTMQGQVNDNGTAGSGNGKGLLYGINPVASLVSANATFFKQLTSIEADVYAVAGSSVEDKVGMQLVQTAADAVKGTHDDVAFSLNNQSGAVGWTYGLEFGRAGGSFPLTPTGTMIYGQGPAGAAFTVGGGIDWHLGTASNYWAQFGNVFSVAGSGAVNTTSSYQLNGQQIIGTGSGNTNVGLSSNITWDPSTHSNTQNKLYLNLNASQSSANIQENFDSYVYLTGSQTAEVNLMHSFFQNQAGATAAQVEGHESSMWNYGSMTEWDGYLALPTNQAGGTISRAYGLKVQANNNNTTAGSIGSWAGLDCEAMGGSGSVPTNNWCLRNGDATQMIGTAGSMHVGSIAGPTAKFQVDTSGNSSSTFGILVNNSSGTHYFVARDDGRIGLGTASGGGLNAEVVISDGSDAFPDAHIGVLQTTKPTVTNGTLNATAADAKGTVTLTAANPTMTFHKAFATAPDCIVTSPTGTAFTYTVSTTALALTGGSAGNTATWHCLQ